MLNLCLSLPHQSAATWGVEWSDGHQRQGLRDERLSEGDESHESHHILPMAQVKWKYVEVQFICRTSQLEMVVSEHAATFYLYSTPMVITLHNKRFLHRLYSMVSGIFDQYHSFSEQTRNILPSTLCQAHKSEKIIHKLLLETTAIGNKHWAQVPDGHVAVVPRLKVVWLLILAVMLWLYHTGVAMSRKHWA